jgi:hypothetical protein
MTLRDRIKGMGLSVSDLVLLTGRSRVTVWRWMRTNRYPYYVSALLRARESAGSSPSTGTAVPSPDARD